MLSVVCGLQAHSSLQLLVSAGEGVSLYVLTLFIQAHKTTASVLETQVCLLIQGTLRGKALLRNRFISHGHGSHLPGRASPPPAPPAPCPGGQEGFASLIFRAGPSGGQCSPALRRTCCGPAEAPRAGPGRAGAARPLRAPAPLPPAAPSPRGGGSPRRRRRLRARGAAAARGAAPVPPPGAVPLRRGGRGWGRAAGGAVRARGAPRSHGVHPGACGAAAMPGHGEGGSLWSVCGTGAEQRRGPPVLRARCGCATSG